MILDVHTILFIGLMIDIICTTVIILLWHYNHKLFQGITFWVLDFIFQTAGLLMINLRGRIPDWMSIVLANTLIVSGAILGYIGLERFLNQKGLQVQNILLLFFFILFYSYFTLIHPSLAIRNLLLSMSILLICSQCAWLMLHRVGSGMRPMARFIGIVFMIYSLVSLARIFEIALYPAAENLFESRARDMIFVIAYQMLFILLMYGLALIVNLRLFTDLRMQEEKLSKAFHSSPNAILLTRMSDGEVFEVNDGFAEITGYSAADVVGKKTLDLNFWVNPDDRRSIVEALSREDEIHGIELKFRKKSGEIITGIFSAEIININNQRTILSNISDITKNKKAEENIKNLLVEKEILLKEVHHRIKNHMSTVMGLLLLQSNSTDDPHTSEILLNAKNRLMSMTHLYDRLYRSESYMEMPLKDFLNPLAEEIVHLFPIDTDVKLEMNIENIILSPKILSPLGIIVNELITNSLKHAFDNRESGRINLSVSREDERIVLIYKDDGPGIPESMDPSKSDGFGLQLIGMLVEQIRGSIRFENRNGTQTILEFKV